MRIDLHTAQGGRSHRPTDPPADRPADQALCVDLSVHEMFTAHALATPDRTALTSDGTHLSYGRLNAGADRLAARLRTAGVHRGSPVGVFLERSADFVTALIAVLKAGGCYVPLDPEYPPARLHTMVETAGIHTLVTRTALTGRLPDDGTTRIRIDEPPDPEHGTAPPAADAATHPDDLAYIMFTSGSTGTPKGVAVRHCGIVRLVDNPGYVNLDSTQVLSHLSSPSFDAATFEIWGALANGARLVIGPPGPLSVGDTAALLRREEVTVSWLTAGLFNVMVDEHLDDLTGIRQLLSGGDTMSPTQARRFLEAAPGSRLVNGYGPTEATTFTACHTVTLEDTRHTRIPVGRPVPGTWVEILDDDLRPVPHDTPGHLYAGGLGLARGYLGDSALTAERFVPDPWARGGRLYATGDLALRRPDGTIDFLGRADGQLKKRGYRIDPAEIEETLRRDPHVRDAAVTLDGKRSDTAQLVAHIVPETATAPGAATGYAGFLAALRARTREQLPAHLVPDRFAALDALPLTANGKLDRAALTATDGRPGQNTQAAVFEDGTEAALAEIWREVLDRDDLTRAADFFDLGGQSLQAARIATRIRDHLGIEVPLATIFDHPTIAELAQAITADSTAPGH
ncbi:non-ribosomal peptide synthetase [Streptomyces montanisoli]|uniref:Non-ribosomal peptide synthetase n=1 Tax=Streptomyces montanisoli TaxID=2798581 RepID=A0A940M8S9_9ACTN|nr:non-ribosomal peptide synthetase [Streptomyces montanisoli]MBP0456874.1 non-ribosomal peptide synthetase [Streptomyces montanisoli]